MDVITYHLLFVFIMFIIECYSIILNDKLSILYHILKTKICWMEDVFQLREKIDTLVTVTLEKGSVRISIAYI
jgi:hypothetical protein